MWECGLEVRRRTASTQKLQKAGAECSKRDLKDVKDPKDIKEAVGRNTLGAANLDAGCT